MSKERIFRPKEDTKGIRNKFKFYYTEKVFNKWMNKFAFPELNYQQIHYIMKKFWCDGTIACSKIESSNGILAGLIKDGKIDMKENNVIFTPWVHADRYNIYDFSTKVRLVNTRGVKFITTQDLEIDKDVVVIYAQKNHKSVFSSIEIKINEIVDLEMKKRVALKSQNQSTLFTFANEDFKQAKRLQEQIEEDNPYIFVNVNDPDKVKNVASGVPYIVDKLQAQIDGRWNDILTTIGVNNIGIDEKKEHLVVDEINANNEDIEQQSFSFLSTIEEGFDRVAKVLGFKVNVIDLNEQFKENEDEIDEKEDEEDDGNDEE